MPKTTKGNGMSPFPFHPTIVDHLRKLIGSFDTHVFPWNIRRRALWEQFHNIQEAAKLADGSPMPKGGKRGTWYGFHDLRRGFATANAESMDLFPLQKLMQHKSLETTRGYVNMAGRLDSAVAGLKVPSILQNSVESRSCGIHAVSSNASDSGRSINRRKSFDTKCRRRDSNPHSHYRNRILNPARLPIPPQRLTV